MDFNEIVAKQRELYIEDLLTFYNEKNGGAKEILMSLNIDNAPAEFRLYRLDHYEIVNGEAKATELQAIRYLDFDPMELLYDDLNVHFNPMYWHGCEFILSPQPADITWLTAWIKKWINENDDNPKDTNGLSGVIHSVTPMKSEEDFHFSVDFGSANMDCFLELIHEIYLQDIKTLKIGSPSMIE